MERDTDLTWTARELIIHTLEVAIYNSTDPVSTPTALTLYCSLEDIRILVKQPLLAGQMTPERATAERKRRIPWLAQPTKPNLESFAAVVSYKQLLYCVLAPWRAAYRTCRGIMGLLV